MFKWPGIALILIFSMNSCRNGSPIVEKKFTDSLLHGHDIPSLSKAVDDDLQFWERRMKDQPENFVAKEKYTAALLMRFHVLADINDLKSADSMLTKLENGAQKIAARQLTLANIKMQQHDFKTAARLISSVRQTGAEAYAANMMKFDADFELGNYSDARLALATVKNKSTFAYMFRQAKWEHLSGKPDSAIAHLMFAATITSDPLLKATALSNAADLHMHSGEMQTAYQLYKQSIQFNPSDFHSIEKIGWIALVQDKNDSLAIRIFEFLQAGIKSPYPLFKLAQAYELKNPSKARLYAREFEKLVSNPVYGSMYHKYLIELYTGILNEPALAVKIAQKEITNRATPQTFAWLAWSLAASGRKSEAEEIYRQKVSGHPLETLELFWMGKTMAVLGKAFNAQQFLKEAKKNHYDLSPAMAKELNQLLQ